MSIRARAAGTHAVSTAPRRHAKGVGVQLHRVASRCACGQASVELVALLPLVAVVAAAAFSFIAASAAAEQAGQAAEAGAVAILQDRDPRAAAWAALPAGARKRAEIAISGHRVTASVRPSLPLPGLAGLLTGHAGADAGKEAAP